MRRQLKREIAASSQSQLAEGYKPKAIKGLSRACTHKLRLITAT